MMTTNNKTRREERREGCWCCCWLLAAAFTFLLLTFYNCPLLRRLRRLGFTTRSTNKIEVFGTIMDPHRARDRFLRWNLHYCVPRFRFQRDGYQYNFNMMLESHQDYNSVLDLFSGPSTSIRCPLLMLNQFENNICGWCGTSTDSSDVYCSWCCSTRFLPFPSILYRFHMHTPFLRGTLSQSADIDCIDSDNVLEDSLPVCQTSYVCGLCSEAVIGNIVDLCSNIYTFDDENDPNTGLALPSCFFSYDGLVPRHIFHASCVFQGVSPLMVTGLDTSSLNFPCWLGCGSFGNIVWSTSNSVSVGHWSNVDLDNWIALRRAWYYGERHDYNFLLRSL